MVSFVVLVSAAGAGTALGQALGVVRASRNTAKDFVFETRQQERSSPYCMTAGLIGAIVGPCFHRDKIRHSGRAGSEIATAFAIDALGL